MNKFKDTVGRFRTRSLFKETCVGDKSFILFTIQEARDLFVETNDPTGYTFATQYLGGWKHWLALKSSAVNPFIEEWEDELDVKLRSLALGNMLKLSQGDKGYQANKFLVDGGWKQKQAGRPTKATVKRETQIASKAYDEFNGVADLQH